MNNAKIESLAKGKYAVVGQLDFDTVVQLWRQTDKLFDDSRAIEIDLNGITHSNSAGLVLLLAWMRMTRRQGKRIQFLHLPAQMQAMTKVCGLEAIIPII